MNDRKLKIAFSKVKEDMYNLYHELETIKSILDLNSKKKDADKQKILTKTDLEKELNEFSNLVSEKISMEIAGIKLEYQTEIARLATELDLVKNHTSSDNSKKTNTKEIEADLNVLKDDFNEKLEAFRLEMTEEISKIYDKFFTELIELQQKTEKTTTKKKVKEEKTKSTKKKSTTKSKTPKEKEEPLYESELKNNKKGSAKIKKIAKWLFVDEDAEEEIENIKQEVKKK